MDTKKSFNIKFQVIEIFERSLSIQPPYPQEPDAKPNFNFRVSSNTLVDEKDKLIIITLKIFVKSLNFENITGLLQIRFGYQVLNFEDLPRNIKGAYGLPKDLENILRNAAISTARGVMFSEFRGTILHNAILPLFDATALEPESPAAK